MKRDYVKKGMSTSLVVVMAMVLALSIAVAVMSGVNLVQSGAEGSLDNTSQGVDRKADQSQCVSSCRAENPRGGPSFYNCRSSC